MSIKKSVLSVATAAVVLGFAAAAPAATTDLGTVTLQDIAATATFDISDTSVAAGKFTDYFTFVYGGSTSPSSAGVNVAASVTASGLQKFFGVSGLGVSLEQLGGSTISYGALNADTGTDITLTKGAEYAFVVSGDATGSRGGRYSGSAAISAVPVPGALVLFGSGLASLGFAARRRKQRA